MEPFFTSNGSAKALLVDMEPKVVNRCLSRSGGWQYDPSLSLVRAEGSGNNWAYGCEVHGPAVAEELTDLIQGVAER